MAVRGKFITLEGPEGAGKSTQAKLLAEALHARGIDSLLTREPGGTPLAEELRSLLKHFKSDSEAMTPEAELLLMNAARAQHVQYKILPALEAGKWVICDRFCDSTLAYQGFARGLDRKMIDHINTFACGSTLPHLTLLLDLSPEDGAKRTNARADVSRDRFDSESRTFHEAIRNGFLTLAKDAPERFAVINAAQEMDAVTADIMEVLRDRMA